MCTFASSKSERSLAIQNDVLQSTPLISKSLSIRIHPNGNLLLLSQIARNQKIGEDADAEFITERSFTEDDIDNSLFYISSFCYHFIEKKRKYVSNISLSIEDMRKYDSAIHSISQSIIYNQDTTIEKGNIIIQALKNIIMS